MFDIPHHPAAVRAQLWTTEAGGPLKKAWWHRRWRPTALPQLPREVCRVVGDPNASPKAVNPQWREEWQWVLLRLSRPRQGPGYEPVWPVVVVSGAAITTWRPVTTEYLALRVGEAVLSIVCRNQAGRYYAPQIHHVNNTPFLNTAENIRGYAKHHSLAVTFC